jgi:predicted helicase
MWPGFWPRMPVTKARIEDIDLPALTAVRTALEEALGVTFEGRKGDRFFRSTLVQTLFYGIFSAWVLWSKKRAPGNITATFDRRITPWELHVPLIRGLFEQMAMPSKLGPLGLVEVLDRTGAALNRVEPEAFFARFEESQAVQYFYEPFLEAFDPELRKELGVWYTPPEIVQYMVSRIDTVLREELGIADGLADPRVYVLDQCCGTGAYLVAVLQRIATTLREQGGDALLGDDLKRAAMARLFGFDLLPAPFVVAHLQLGLLLQTLGAPLSDSANERAGVYLTNALTGWAPPTGPKQRLLLPELEAERDAAEHVKRDVPILAILGNPPYNGFAGLAMDEERDLTNAYRTTKHAPAPQGQGLNDLYIRFFRMAERRIVERTGQGIVCFISNYSWLDGLSFTGMRERYLEVFDKIWIDKLHGDRIISEYAPDGRTSETVFAMEGTSPGIKIGTAVSLLVRKKDATTSSPNMILYRDMHEARAVERCSALLASLSKPNIDDWYIQLQPVLGLGLPFKPGLVGLSYLSWPLLPDLFPVSFPGVKTSRDDVVVDIDRARLVRRMEQYFDPAISHEEMRRISPGAMQSTAAFNAEAVRDQLCKRGFKPENVVRYFYRPFDVRWLYRETETKLLDRNRAEYYPHVYAGNLWLSVGQRNRKEDFYQPQFTTLLADHYIVESNVGMFPLYLRSDHKRSSSFDHDSSGEPRPNLSTQAASYLSRLDVTEQDLFYHTLAVLHAPMYRMENAGALRQDWPRVPLP